MSDPNGEYPYYATVEFFKYPQLDDTYSTDERSTAGIVQLIHIELNDEPPSVTKRKEELLNK